MEYEHFFPLLSFFLPLDELRQNPDFVSWLRSTPNLADQFATEIEYNLPAPRQAHYQEEFREMRRSITTYLQELEEFLGYYPVQVTSGILDKIQTLEMGILIVNLIFNLVKSLLVLISVLIIYSLLMVSIESKYFEIAVIRMVGLERQGIVNLILCQSFLYVLPAISLAFAASYVLLGQAATYFDNEYSVKIDRVPSLSSALQAVFIGSVIPLVSSFLPIRAALSRSITESMDVQKSKTQAIYVNILQKNRKDVTGLVIFGLIALSYGFSIYYLLPLSLVSFNFSLATTIFLFILFGMIAAMGLLALNLMPYLNVLVARILLSWESQSMKQTVLKNLIAHKERNQMTSLMFSLTLGFVIFLNIVCKIPFSKDLADI